LAYDLDFFEPDPTRRMVDPAYFGDDRLEEEIATAFRRLVALGVRIPKDS
jgi:hypothetical protein